MGQGEARAGHQGPFNEFISQIILPAAQGPRDSREGRGEGGSFYLLAGLCKNSCDRRRERTPSPKENKNTKGNLAALIWLYSTGTSQISRGRVVEWWRRNYNN